MADDKAYKEALKNLDNLVKKQEAMKKTTDALKDSWNAISSELFKISGAEFFKQVPRSAEELKKMADNVAELEGKFNEVGKAFAKAIDAEGAGSKINKLANAIKDDLGDAFKSTSDISNQLMSSYFTELKSKFGDQIKDEEHLKNLLSGKIKDQDEFLKKLKETEVFKKAELEYADDYNKKQKIFKDRLSELKKQYTELNTIKDDEIVKFAEIISQTESLVDGTMDWEKITRDLSGEQKKLLAILHSDDAAMLSMVDRMNEAADTAETIKDKMLKPKDVFSLEKAFESFGGRIKKDLVGSLFEFDEVLHDVQKNTGIMMVENSTSFAMMTSEVAQFGMSVEQAGKMMGDLSQELQSTDFSVLSKAAEDFASIEGATGAAAEDITNISGELMRMGESSGQVKDFMEGADQMARNFGISSKKAIGDISKNIKKMRQMGFVGGEESLKKMVMTANRLRMNVDEIFDVAKRARSIEGAMDMAAELQLAGGSFANINPMDLLAAARKGPAELQKILTGMGKDIGHFNKETQKYEFDPVDVDRLQMVADATGQSLDSIQNMIQKNAEDTEKLTPFQGMLDGLNEADQELAKSGLSQMLKMGKDGKLMVDVDSDMAKRMGVDSLEDLQSMSGEQLKEKMNADAATLEEQNKRNQSLKKSFDNFMNGLLGALNVFQPVLEFLGKVLQEVSAVFSMLPGWGKVLVSGLLVAFGIFGTSVGAFITQGVGGFLKGALSFGKSTFDFVKNLTTGKGAEALSGLAGGIKQKFMGKAAGGVADIAKDTAMKATGGVAESVGQSGSALATSKVSSKIDMGGLLKFSAAMALIGAAVAAFGFGINQMGGLGMLDILGKGAIAIGLLALGVFGIAKLSSGIDLGGIVKFSLAMALVGLALIPFAFAATMMTGIDWMSVLAGVGVMALVMTGLALLGTVAMAVGWLILLGAGLLAAAGLALMVAAEGLLMTADAFNALGAIDWKGFSTMGVALLSVVPGMLGFSFAAMLFSNPLALLGIMMMTWALGGLVSVMAPLADSLTLGADSLDRFASGLEKLSAAADKLSLEKLEKLKELSDSMASAGAGSAAMASMANSNNGNNSGSGGDGEVRKIEVNVKMNGRDIQNFIVKDTAIIK